MHKFKFKVNLIESERGWGQSVDVVEFDTYEKAVAYIESVNSKNTASSAPDWYMRAEPNNFKIEDSLKSGKI